MATPQKVIVVTGASRGIGLAAAEYLLKQKCKIVVVARSHAPLEEIRKKYPDQVAVLAGDLGDFSLGAKIVDLAVKTFNQLDGLIINHAVLAPVTRISESSAEDWSTAFNINIFSAVAMVKAALPELRKSRGKIIFTSSGAAIHGSSTWGAYGAAKAALNHLTMTLAVEEPDVTSISIRPGTVDTDMQRDLREVYHTVMDKKDAEKFAILKSSGQLLRPDKPGNVIAKLALGGRHELSGKFLTWNDKDLAAFQDP